MTTINSAGFFMTLSATGSWARLQIVCNFFIVYIRQIKSTASEPQQQQHVYAPHKPGTRRQVFPASERIERLAWKVLYQRSPWCLSSSSHARSPERNETNKSPRTKDTCARSNRSRRTQHCFTWPWFVYFDDLTELFVASDPCWDLS